MAKNLRDIRKALKADGVFYTDTKLAEIMKSLITVDYDEVYDPTCGSGCLLSVFPDDVMKFGQELDENELAIAESSLPNFCGKAGDTLKKDLFGNKRFKVIMANPPFSVKWEPNPDDPRFSCAPAIAPRSKADYAFLLHILYHLDDGGQAIVLNFPGILYRGNSEGKIRQWLIESGFISKVIHVEGDYFVDTKIATAIVILDKTKKHDEITFSNLVDGKEVTVPIATIAENNYQLSPNLYLPDEVEDKPEIDPWKLEVDCREIAIRRIRSELETSLMVSLIEGWDIDDFIDKVIETAKTFKDETKNRMPL